MSAEHSSDASDDASGEGQWLTYTELAKHRGIDRGSAVRLAIRRQWRRQKGNAGREVRVLVPPDMLTDDRSVDASEVASGHTSADIAGVVSGFETALAVLREQLERSGQRVEVSERRADRLDILLEAERGRLVAIEAKLASTESVAAGLRDQLEQAHAKAQAAAQAADELRRAETERQARGLVARLRQAWRGR